MNLAIDIGNSAIKYGIFNGRELIDSGIGNIPEQELIDKLTSDFSEIDSLIISSVRKTASDYHTDTSRSLKCVNLNEYTAIPLINNYGSKETLGKDRIALAVAAWSKFPNQNSLVIDVGTCLTLDLILSDGSYSGGIISPGIQLRLDAMHERTNMLPKIKFSGNQEIKLVGNSTESCMISGAFNGLILEIKQAISEFEKQYSEINVLITGGDAKHFENQLKNSIFADPKLVLRGLNEILLFNLE